LTSRRSANNANLKRIAMKIPLTKLLCVNFLLWPIPPDAYCAESTITLRKASLSTTNFEDCTFDFSDTAYFYHLSRKVAFRTSSDDIYCSMHLNFDANAYFTPLSDIRLTVLSLRQAEQVMAAQGFYKNKTGNWEFEGSSLGIYFVSFKHLSLEQRRVGNDLVLIGRQIESAKDQVGTPMTFEGVHILRITPTYLVRMDLPFDFETNASTRDAIVNDMIKLVESVRVTTSP
jgi:hypothetical protein